jgi:hypothetical protein
MDILWGEGGFTAMPYQPREMNLADYNAYGGSMPAFLDYSGCAWWEYVWYCSPMDAGNYDLVRNYLDYTVGPVMTDPWKTQGQTVLHNAPQNVPYNALVDHQRYGGYLSSLSLLLSTLRQDSHPGSAQQHEVIHATTSGRLLHEASTVFCTDTSEALILGTEVPQYVFDGEPTHTGSFGKPDFATANSSNNRRDLVSVVQAIPDYINGLGGACAWDHYMRTNRLRTWYDTDAWFGWVGDSLVLSYGGITQINHSNGQYSKIHFNVDYTWHFELRVLDYAVAPLYGTWRTERALQAGTVTREQSNAFIKANYTPSGTGWWSNRNYTLTLPLGVAVVSKLAGDQPQDQAVSAFTAMASSLDQYLEHRSKTYFNAAVRSSSEAVDEFRSFMATNYLESLTEIRELLALFPDLEPIERFLEIIPAGKYLEAGFRLVDFAARTYLLAKFGLLPFITDIEQFATKYDRIAAILQQRLGSGHDARGKFSYTFEPDTALKDFQLVCRSKVRIRIPPGSVSASLLPLSVAGLEPSLAQLWDIVPFSFAIDWFTNLGDKLELVDNAVFMSTAIVDYTVHSYTMYRDLTDDDLVGTGLTTQGLCQYKHYWRTTSRYNPNVMRNYTYDWWADGSVPADLAGSLVWVLIRPD